MTKRILIATVVIVTLGWSSVSIAFPEPEFYHEPADGTLAGLGGIYGTGSKQDLGIKCSHCHIKGAGTIGISVSVTKGNAGSPTGWDNVGGLDGYEPGARYTIQVQLTNEHLIDNSSGRVDQNGFSATFETLDGKLAGTLYPDAAGSYNSANNCPTDSSVYGAPNGATTLIYGDCHGVLFFYDPGRTSWTFDWQAPAAGAGEITLYVATVDGDTDGKSSLDDDAAEKSFSLLEGP